MGLAPRIQVVVVLITIVDKMWLMKLQTFMLFLTKQLLLVRRVAVW